MYHIEMPLVALFGYPKDLDQLIFLGRQEEIVLTLGEEIRSTMLQFLAFCNGSRTLEEIQVLMPEIDKLTFEAIVSTCAGEGIICDSREILYSFHADSANPLRFVSGLSSRQAAELIESRAKIVQTSNEIKVFLPQSQFLSLLQSRKSAEGFEDKPIPAEMLGGLLASMYSLGNKRPVPSAGKLYPLDLYIFVKSIEQSIPRGLYRYDPERLALYNLDKEILDGQLNRALDSYQAEDVSFVIFIAADLERVATKYSNRGYRLAHIEVGHVAQNAYLFCAENGIGIREICGFQDQLTAQLLELKYPQKAVLSVLFVGAESDGKIQNDLPGIADRLRDSLVGPNKPIEWIRSRSLVYDGDTFPKVASIAKFRSVNQKGELLSHPDDVSFGLSDVSHEAAIKAMVEGFERHVCSLVRIDAHAKAVDLDSDFFDPRIATPFLPEQVVKLDLHHFDPKKEWDWVVGERLSSQKRVYVPVDHVYYPVSSHAGRSLCYRSNSSGVAAHFDSEEAKSRALYELVERDAILVTWHSQRRVKEVPAERLSQYVVARTRYWREKGWKLMFLDLTLDSVPVILAVIYSRHMYPAFVSGSSAHSSRLVAAQKALDEAETILILALGEEEKKKINLKDVMSPMDHGRLYFDHENLAYIEWLLNPSGVSLDQEIATPDLISMFDPVMVSLTPKEHPSGIHVSRILSEKLLPINFGYGTEHHGHQRFEVVGLSQVPESLFFPHFFA